jgi:hypothetical protein
MLIRKYCAPDTIGYAEQARLSIRPHVWSQTMRIRDFRHNKLPPLSVQETNQHFTQTDGGTNQPNRVSSFLRFLPCTKRTKMTLNGEVCLFVIFSRFRDEVCNRRSTNILVPLDKNLVSISHLILSRSCTPHFSRFKSLRQILGKLQIVSL